MCSLIEIIVLSTKQFCVQHTQPNRHISTAQAIIDNPATIELFLEWEGMNANKSRGEALEGRHWRYLSTIVLEYAHKMYSLIPVKSREDTIRQITEMPA